jgi:hypothetical protein
LKLFEFHTAHSSSIFTGSISMQSIILRTFADEYIIKGECHVFLRVRRDIALEEKVNFIFVHNYSLVYVVAWDTMLQTGRPRVRFPMRLLDFHLT